MREDGTLTAEEARDRLRRLDVAVGDLDASESEQRGRKRAAERLANAPARRALLGDLDTLARAWGGFSVAERRQVVDLLAERIDLLAERIELEGDAVEVIWRDVGELLREEKELSGASCRKRQNLHRLARAAKKRAA